MALVLIFVFCQLFGHLHGIFVQTVLKQPGLLRFLHHSSKANAEHAFYQCKKNTEHLQCLVCEHDVLYVCHIMNVASSYHRFRNNHHIHHIQHLLTSCTSPEIISRECLICLSLNFLHELLPLHRLLLCTRGSVFGVL